MTEPDFPYPKKSFETTKTNSSNAQPTTESIPPASSSPNQDESKLICPKCKKVFKSNEELSMHVETTHQSPKKKL